MSRLHDFERLIDDKLRQLFRGPVPQGQKGELIEVHRAILDDVAKHADSLPRGRRSFSFPQVGVRVLLPGPEHRRSYEVAFIEGDALARDIAARLAGEHIELPEKFQVEVEMVDVLPADIAARGFDVSYRSAAPAPKQAATPAVWLKVLHGTAEQGEYSFRRNRINIGRLSNVLDSNQRMLRRNDVAFNELSEAPNSTVSRTHAHIEFDSSARQFRLFDDRSAHGTTVLREGNLIQVPKGTSKGVALRPGDEIVVGQARLCFDLPSDMQTE